MIEPSELGRVTKFNLYDDRLPEGINPELSTFAYSVRDAAARYEAGWLSGLVLYTLTSWRSRPSSVSLYSISEIEGAYDAIVELSGVLVDIYLDALILPIVVPITAEQWSTQVGREGILFRRIASRGLLCYQKGMRQ